MFARINGTLRCGAGARRDAGPSAWSGSGGTRMPLRSLSRSLVNRLLMRRLKGPFAAVGGHAYEAALPGLEHAADRPDDLARSTLAVYEDGRPLPLPHCLHDEVRAHGLGRYLHWGPRVLFSASDNSDPNTNGRT